MEINADISVRVSAQRALLGTVLPSMRAVSLDVTPDLKKISCRFHFEAEPTFSEKEDAFSIFGEIYSDFWQSIEEENIECIACTPPNEPECLRLQVYRRCEFEWVQWPVQLGAQRDEPASGGSAR